MWLSCFLLWWVAHITWIFRDTGIGWKFFWVTGMGPARSEVIWVTWNSPYFSLPKAGCFSPIRLWCPVLGCAGVRSRMGMCSTPSPHSFLAIHTWPFSSPSPNAAQRWGKSCGLKLWDSAEKVPVHHQRGQGPPCGPSSGASIYKKRLAQEEAIRVGTLRAYAASTISWVCGFLGKRVPPTPSLSFLTCKLGESHPYLVRLLEGWLPQWI